MTPAGRLETVASRVSDAAINRSERSEQSNPSGASNQTQRAERAIKHRARSVIPRPQRAAYGQQLELGTVGDQLLDRIEYVDQMRSISADRRYADARTTVQLEDDQLRPH